MHSSAKVLFTQILLHNSDNKTHINKFFQRWVQINRLCVAVGSGRNRASTVPRRAQPLACVGSAITEIVLAEMKKTKKHNAQLIYIQSDINFGELVEIV